MLNSPTPDQAQVDVLILGAGCAGTSLAAQLQAQGFAGSVALLDGRASWGDEARWCSWSPLPDLMKSVVSRRWNRWEVRASNERVAVQQAPDLAYEEVYAPDFYAHFHRNWRSPDSAVRLYARQFVSHVETSSEGGFAIANGHTWRARHIFDARHGGANTMHQLDAPGHVRLHQTFVGWVVEFARPVFSARTATLMDFRVPQGQSAAEGVRFAYVLPHGPTRALVEMTAFSAQPLGAREHEAMLRAYLRDTVGDDFQIVARENGDLPMASAPLDAQIGANWRAIGVAGGAARPSSGYAFARIQREAHNLARALTRDEPLPARPQNQNAFGAFKYAYMDEIFLEAIAHSPAFAIECFTRLFERTDPGALVNFLNETSTLADDARIVAALPKLAFLRASARRAKARFGAHINSYSAWKPPVPSPVRAARETVPR